MSSEGADDPSDRDAHTGRIGYRQPPKEHQFKKGHSGNPKGRPRKRPLPETRMKGLAEIKAAEEALKLEAYRLIPVRDGSRVEEIPAIQALYRAMFLNALKGNRHSQKLMMESLIKVEDQEYARMAEAMDTAIKYKVEWERTLERYRELGIPEPVLLPHPDDVVIDLQKGSFQVLGPATAEEKAELDGIIRRRDALAEHLETLAARLASTDDPSLKESYLDDLGQGRRSLGSLNDMLPERYRCDVQALLNGEGS